MALFNKDAATAPDAPATSRARGSANPAEQHNIIGKDTVIEGTIRSSGNVHISGTVNGNVEVQGRTVVMPDGRVEGELQSTTAEIGGRVHGEVAVNERLVLKATAVIEGDIRTGKLVIEDGATFTGRCDMSGTASPTRRPSSERPRSEAAEPPETSERSGEGRPTRRIGGNPDSTHTAQA
ncbi:MAG: polymer-forming cytoskeletal protein [Rubricoccaceae bacterium]|nr:polymer-forming cytoskeletal protein [Rubricoccaceae bacterium]